MPTSRTRALVTGAGGFIGHHLVAHLRDKGYWVRGVDVQHPEHRPTEADEFCLLDLREQAAADAATADVDEVYALAADMGGMGFISANHGTIIRNNALINFNTLEEARRNGVTRLFFASSACVYPDYRQGEPQVAPLREQDAHPASPEGGYGWEKLITEKACEYYREEFGLETRVARLHNIYGPYSTYDGGREKAPAALARKVALAAEGGEVEIWGDGAQTRSFCFVDDCVIGIDRLMRSNVAGPVNLGTERLITIDDLAGLLLRIAGKTDVALVHRSGPQGVRGRNSDNTLLREALGWEPSTSLEAGMTATYRWINEELTARAEPVSARSVLDRH